MRTRKTMNPNRRCIIWSSPSFGEHDHVKPPELVIVTSNVSIDDSPFNVGSDLEVSKNNILERCEPIKEMEQGLFIHADLLDRHKCHLVTDSR